MPDRQSLERLFLEHLRFIERAAAIACRNGGLRGPEADDFAAWLKMKLMEDDYAVFRRFRGEAKFTTYLVPVISGQFHEYQRLHGGRWRASASALRLGPPAPRLEALVYRDGYTLEQAAEKLRTGGDTGLSDIELARLLGQLPVRGPLRPVQVTSEHVLPATEGGERADAHVVKEEGEVLRERILSALRRVMDRLEGEDQMIVRMHLAEGETLASVARALGLEQKPLYRRVQRLRARLREYLLAEGVEGGDVLDLLSERSEP